MKELCPKGRKRSAVINSFERACSRKHKKFYTDLSRERAPKWTVQKRSAATEKQLMGSMEVGPKDLGSNGTEDQQYQRPRKTVKAVILESYLQEIRDLHNLVN